MDNSSKSKKSLIIIWILVLLVTVLGISYAYFRKTSTQGKLNQVDILKCLEATITDETSAINLTDEFPIPNAEGMTKTPYTFKVTNNCEIYIYADISLEVLSSSTLGAAYVRAALNSQSNILTGYETGIPTITGATSYVISKDNLIPPTDTSVFNLRLWIDEATTMEQGFDKTFEGKIVVAYSATKMPSHVAFKLPSNPKGIYNTSFSGAEWNHKTASLEISSINGDENNIELTNASFEGINLTSYIMSLAGSEQGTGKLVNETIEVFESTALKTSSYYTNETNSDFSWDNTTSTWTSTNKTDSSTGTLTFKPNTTGIVSLCYTVSSETEYDFARFYVDDVIKEETSGDNSRCINLGNLTTSNTVKVTYSKDGGVSERNDNVIFTINDGNSQIKSTGYRYQGKDPNNWIMFNGEYWRIIGVFDSETHGKENQNLVKIIREDILGGFSWNKSNVNDWNASSLKALLNDYYYLGIDESTATYCYGYSDIPGNCNFIKNGITKDFYRNMIENVTWKLGGHHTTSSTTEAWYNAERGTNVYNDRPTSGEGVIGLIYPSDYGFSVLASSCFRTTNIGYYTNDNCAGNSWLYGKGAFWTITPSIENVSLGIRIHHNGSLYRDNNVNNGYGIRPALYLKSNIKKISGDGSIVNPYIIMN